MSDEIQKTTQEVANAVGKGADLANKLVGLFNTIFGAAASEMGLTFQDWAREYRHKNLLRIYDRVRAIHEARKLEGKTIPIPLRYALPLLEKAAVEDDDSLQDLWAGLIANATDPSKHLDLKRLFTDILGSLEPVDVRILNYLGGQGWRQFQSVAGGILFVHLQQQLKIHEHDLRISLQNLHRLGLLLDEYPTDKNDNSRFAPLTNVGSTSFGAILMRVGASFRLTPLGHELLRVCKA